eukprot:816822-Prymnesium_polylepis.1
MPSRGAWCGSVVAGERPAALRSVGSQSVTWKREGSAPPTGATNPCARDAARPPRGQPRDCQCVRGGGAASTTHAAGRLRRPTQRGGFDDPRSGAYSDAHAPLVQLVLLPAVRPVAIDDVRVEAARSRHALLPAGRAVISGEDHDGGGECACGVERVDDVAHLTGGRRTGEGIAVCRSERGTSRECGVEGVRRGGNAACRGCDAEGMRRGGSAAWRECGAEGVRRGGCAACEGIAAWRGCGVEGARRGAPSRRCARAS